MRKIVAQMIDPKIGWNIQSVLSLLLYFENDGGGESAVQYTTQ